MKRKELTALQDEVETKEKEASEVVNQVSSLDTCLDSGKTQEIIELEKEIADLKEDIEATQKEVQELQDKEQELG